MRDSPVVAYAGRPGNLEKRLAGTPNPKWEAKRLALAAEIQELDAALEAASRGADAPVRTSASPEALAVPRGGSAVAREQQDFGLFVKAQRQTRPAARKKQAPTTRIRAGLVDGLEASSNDSPVRSKGSARGGRKPVPSPKPEDVLNAAPARRSPTYKKTKTATPSAAWFASYEVVTKDIEAELSKMVHAKSKEAEDLAQRVGELELKLQQVIADGEDRVAAKDEEIAKLQHTIVECDSLLGDNQEGLCASETQGKSLCQRIQRLKALHADEVHVLQLRMHTEEASLESLGNQLVRLQNVVQDCDRVMLDMVAQKQAAHDSAGEASAKLAKSLKQMAAIRDLNRSFADRAIEAEEKAARAEIEVNGLREALHLQEQGGHQRPRNGKGRPAAAQESAQKLQPQRSKCHASPGSNQHMDIYQQCLRQAGLSPLERKGIDSKGARLQREARLPSSRVMSPTKEELKNRLANVERCREEERQQREYLAEKLVLFDQQLSDRSETVLATEELQKAHVQYLQADNARLRQSLQEEQRLKDEACQEQMRLLDEDAAHREVQSCLQLVQDRQIEKIEQLNTVKAVLTERVAAMEGVVAERAQESMFESEAIIHQSECLHLVVGNLEALLARTQCEMQEKLAKIQNARKDSVEMQSTNRAEIALEQGLQIETERVVTARPNETVDREWLEAMAGEILECKLDVMLEQKDMSRTLTALDPSMVRGESSHIYSLEYENAELRNQVKALLESLASTAEIRDDFAMELAAAQAILRKHGTSSAPFQLGPVRTSETLNESLKSDQCVDMLPLIAVHGDLHGEATGAADEMQGDRVAVGDISELPGVAVRLRDAAVGDDGEGVGREHDIIVVGGTLDDEPETRIERIGDGTGVVDGAWGGDGADDVHEEGSGGADVITEMQGDKVGVEDMNEEPDAACKIQERAIFVDLEVQEGCPAQIDESPGHVGVTDTVRLCTVCQRKKNKDDFSKKQWSKGGKTRKCVACTS